MRSMRARVRCCSIVVLGLVACASANAQSTYFRFSDMDLRDPHVFVSQAPFGCLDVTDPNFTGFSVNGQIQTSIQTDANGDGLLDRSTLVEFLPLNQALTTNLFDSGRADCTAPLASTACGPINSSAIAGNATLQTSGTCLGTVPGSIVHVYSPTVTAANSPCFASPVGTITLDLGGIPAQLTGAQIASRFVGTPATSLDNGLLRGFISEVDADNTILPATLPVIGGRPLSSLFPGGTGNCAAFSDKDTFNGVVGWWLYLNYVASKPAFSNFVDGFANGFEP